MTLLSLSLNDTSDTCVNFLDISVLLNNGILSTDLYTKPTDKHQYLFQTSCHPHACKKGITFGQVLRIRRICSTDALFNKRAEELCSYLVSRGYVKEHVRREIDKARCIPREEVLKDKVRNNNKRIPFVVIFNPELPNTAAILRRLHLVLQSFRRCMDAIERVPMVAFRRPKSLKDRHVLRHGLDWIGKTWTGLIKHGLIKHGVIKHGLIKHGVIKQGFMTK